MFIINLLSVLHGEWNPDSLSWPLRSCIIMGSYTTILSILPPSVITLHPHSSLVYFANMPRQFPLSGLCIICSHFLEGPSLYLHMNNTFLSLKRAFSDHLLPSISLYYIMYCILLSDIALLIFSLYFYTSY